MIDYSKLNWAKLPGIALKSEFRCSDVRYSVYPDNTATVTCWIEETGTGHRLQAVMTCRGDERMWRLSASDVAIETLDAFIRALHPIALFVEAEVVQQQRAALLLELRTGGPFFKENWWSWGCR